MAADGGMKLVFKPEYTVYQLESCTATCLASIVAPPVSQERRAPVSISLVLDKSGSMSGTKISLVKATCLFLLKQLGARDSVSIISFDDRVTQEHSLVKATPENKESVKDAIESIYVGSTTNLSGGLFKGLTEQLDALSSAEPPSADDGANEEQPRTTVHSVFLFTDGAANSGIRDSDTLLSVMRTMLAPQQPGSTSTAGEPHQESRTLVSPVKVHTFGYGSGHSVDMLKGIADTGNGTYYYVESEENIPEVFADALGGLLSVYAQNVELKISSIADHAIEGVRTGFPSITDGGTTTVQVPDIYAEERKDVVVDVRLAAAPIEAGTSSDPSNIAKVALTYVNIISGALEEKEAELSVERSALTPAMSPDEEVQMHRVRLTVADRLRDAMQLADTGMYNQAQTVLAEQEEMLNNLMVQEAATDDEDDQSVTTSLPAQTRQRNNRFLHGILFNSPPSTTSQTSPTSAMSATGLMYASLQDDVRRTRQSMRQPAEWSQGARNATLTMMTSHSTQRSSGMGYSRPRPSIDRPAPAPTARRLSVAPNMQTIGVPQRMIPPPVAEDVPAGTTATRETARRISLWGRVRSIFGHRHQEQRAHNTEAAASSSRRPTRPDVTAHRLTPSPPPPSRAMDQQYEPRHASYNPYANSMQQNMVMEMTASLRSP